MKKIGSKRSAADKLNSEMLALLERRKLIERTTETTREIELTGSAKELLKKGISSTKETNVLTSNLIRSCAWKQTSFRRYDIQAPTPEKRIGKNIRIR